MRNDIIHAEGMLFKRLTFLYLRAPTLFRKNRGLLLLSIIGLFLDSAEGRENKKEPDIQRMQAKIWRLTLENDFLENTLTKAGMLSVKG